MKQPPSAANFLFWLSLIYLVFYLSKKETNLLPMKTTYIFNGKSSNICLEAYHNSTRLADLLKPQNFEQKQWKNPKADKT